MPELSANQGTVSSLKAQAMAGVRWSAASQVGRQSTQFIGTVLLAHLLGPSEFGLMGMALVVMGFISLFRDLGTGAAVIQSRDPSPALLSSVFWLNAAFGVLAMILVLVGAPMVGIAYGEPRVADVLRVLAAGFVVSGLGTLQQALLERSLQFKALAEAELISAVTGTAVGIGMAISKAGVWSLVAQSLMTAAVSTILLWHRSRWRPVPTIDWSELKAVGLFSVNLMGFNLTNYVSRNADYFLIGRFLGAEQLGVYYLAYRILLIPVQGIAFVAGRVLFPVLSRIRGDDELAASAYVRVVTSISLVSFPVMVCIALAAGPFVPAVLGERWERLVGLIVIFAPVGLLQSVGTTVGTIYQAKGRTDLQFRWGMASGLLTVGAFAIGLRWGTVGVAAAYLAVTCILFYPSLAIPCRLIGLEFGRLIRALVPTFLGSTLMILAMVATRAMFAEHLPHLATLLLALALGLVSYGGMHWLGNRRAVLEAWQLSGMGKVGATGIAAHRRHS